MSCFSLRGKYNIADNAAGAPIRVFDYVSPDRTRAWKVSRAYFWPITIRADTGGEEGKYVMQAALMTDFKKGISWDSINDPTENRSFAWGQWSGFQRDHASGDFISAETEDLASMVIDPDTIITKELWVVLCSTKEGTTNPTRDWGYMIELEEMKVSPSQSVFQQIKGMGQDVTR